MNNELTETTRWALAGAAASHGDEDLLGQLIGKRNVYAMKTILQNFEELCDKIDSESDIEKLAQLIQQNYEAEDNRLSGAKPAVIQQKPAAKRRPKHKKTSYPVRNENLLYRIADAGLLNKLHGITNDRYKTYYFDRDPEVKAIISTFVKETGDHTVWLN